MSSRRRPWFRALAPMLGLMGLFGVLEIAQRIASASAGTYRLSEEAVRARERSIWMASEDPILVYERRPDYVKDGVRQTEAHGILAPRDVPVDPPPGSFRIAVLGDSIAAGLIWKHEDRFPGRLEALLRDAPPLAGRTFEVLNFAVDGYRTIQEARLLELRVEPFRPDLIVLQYCLNDPGNSMTPASWFMPPPEPPVSHFLDLLFRRLALMRYDPRHSDHVPVVGPGQDHEDYWYRLYQPDSRSWKSVVEGFERIGAVAARRRIPVLVVIFPFFLDSGWEDPRSLGFHDRVSREARRCGFGVLDLIETYRTRTVAELREREGDIFHPNPEGHRLAAVAIHRKIAALLRSVPPGGSGSGVVRELVPEKRSGGKALPEAYRRADGSSPATVVP